MKKFTSVVLVFLSTIISCYAQQEANFWYFGNNAGLDFTSGTPVSIAGGQTNTIEGTASISDGNGNLLFYSDGINVWNANHIQMPNGFGLTGNGSSTQSALIVPQPGSSTLYYVFTTGGITFDYSIVDMTLNGGLGDVTVKNTMVHPSSSERATAVRMPNGIDFWIIGHESVGSNFFAYQLTSAGISSTPVISNVGVAQTGNDNIGYLKASNAGDKLAMAVRYKDLFELFDFNKATGVVSNVITFPAFDKPYSVQFSPDDTRLYMSGGLAGAYLFQADLTAGSPAAIVASAMSVGTVSGGSGWAIQLGPDCKIYLVHFNTSIGCIHDPNALGTACNFVDNQFNLTSGSAGLGLPNFFEMPGCYGFNIQSGCLGDSTYFSLGNTTAVIGALWNFGDTLSGTNNTASVFNPVHYYAIAGTYTVQVILYYLSGNVDTLYAPVTVASAPNVNLGNDTVICFGSSVLLDAGSGYGSYLWNNGSTSQTFSASDEGLYIVTVSDGNCFGVDSVLIDTIQCLQPNVAFSSNDTLVCEKTCLDFFDLSTNNPVSWQWYFPNAVPDTSTLQNPTNICFNNYGTYDVTLIACNSNGCDTLIVPAFIAIFQSPSVPQVVQSNDTLFCLAQGVTYQWYFNTVAIPGATDSFYVFTQQGLYYCIITDSNYCDAASNAITISSMNEFQNQSFDFEILPNPNNGTMEIIMNNGLNLQNAEVEIYDTKGKLLYRDNINQHRFFISLNAAAGIYSISIKKNDIRINKPLILK